MKKLLGRLLPAVLLAVVVYLAYGLILKMYFWVDDWGLAYKMVFPSSFPRPSNLGAGIFGEGAYRYLATPFIFLYPIFGLDAGKYFLLALFQYFIASYVLYLFIRSVTGNKNLALGAGMIFASGFIGSFAMYRLSNSFQLIETTTISILVAWCLIKHYQTRKLSYYFLSILLFIGSLEFYFLRSHGLILIVFGAIVFVKALKLKKDKLLVVVKQIPFVLIYYFFYFIDYRGGAETGGSSGLSLIADLKTEIISNHNLLIFKNLFLTFTNMMFPDKALQVLFPKNSIANVENTAIIIGFLVLVLATVIYITKRKEKVSALIPFSLIWILSNIFIYFLYMPTSVLASNSRYELPALVGVAIFYSTALFLIGKKWLFRTGIVLIAGIFIYFSRQEQGYLIKRVSVPDKQGYNLIMSEVKNISQRSTFYVDVENDPEIKSNVLGNLAQLGIPAIFKFKGQIQIANSFDDICNLIKAGSTDLDNVYTYYFSRQGYISTTNQTRSEIVKRCL